jgi:glutaredoxin-related protein
MEDNENTLTITDILCNDGSELELQRFSNGNQFQLFVYEPHQGLASVLLTSEQAETLARFIQEGWR